jgi:hypothetical protein
MKESLSAQEKGPSPSQGILSGGGIEGEGHCSDGLAESGDSKDSESRAALNKDPLWGAAPHLPLRGGETLRSRRGRGTAEFDSRREHSL